MSKVSSTLWLSELSFIRYFFYETYAPWEMREYRSTCFHTMCTIATYKDNTSKDLNLDVVWDSWDYFNLTMYPLDSCLFLKTWILWSLSWSVIKRSWEIRSSRTSPEKRIELGVRDSRKEKDHYMNTIALTCIHWSTNYVVLRKQTWLWIQNKYYVRKRSREL